MSDDPFGSDPRELHRGTDPDTSRDAAHQTDPTKSERRVYGLIQAHNERGLTSDDVAAMLNQELSLISPRFSKLEEKGLIRKTGARRKTRRGGYANVYEINPDREQIAERKMRRAELIDFIKRSKGCMNDMFMVAEAEEILRREA